MMRRSKRQTKANPDSPQESDIPTQQPISKQETGAVIQRRNRNASSKQQQQQQPHKQEEQEEQQVISQNNQQTNPTQRELDSVVVNLASQLEKASHSQDPVENSRPKRVRKITEKAEQGLLAKQSKVQVNKKKSSSKSSETCTEEIIECPKSTNNSVAQGKKALKNTRTRNSLNQTTPIQSDTMDMDIEHITVQDKKPEENTLTSLACIDFNNKKSQTLSEVEDSLIQNEKKEDQKELEEEEEEKEDQGQNENSEQNSEEEDNEEDEQNEDKGNDKDKDEENEEQQKLNTQSNHLQQDNESKNEQNKQCETKMEIEEDKPVQDSSVDPEIAHLPVVKKPRSYVSKKSKLLEKQNKTDLINKEKKQEEKKEKKNIIQKEDEINEQQDDENQEDDQNKDENEIEDDEEDDAIGDGSNGGKAKKMPWSEEEDRLVIHLVEQHGPQKWTFIAQHIPGRIGKQCRERWHNHLNPKINKEPWGDDEEWILFLCHRYKGNKWAEITQYLPGRTDNAIKNHWNSSMKKRIPELYQRFSLIKVGEEPEYDITPMYKNFEEEILKSLLAMTDMGEDYFIQTTRRRRNNNNANNTSNNNNTVLSTTSNNNNNITDDINSVNNISENPNNDQASTITPTPIVQQIKVKKSKKAQLIATASEAEEKLTENENQEQAIPSIPLTKKASKAAQKAAAKLALQAQQNIQSELNLEGSAQSNINNQFTPNNNNKSSHHSNNFKTFPNSAAASTADVKEIIQRIPHNMKEFESFRKQIILYSDEYYQQQQQLQQTPNESQYSMNILSADKCPTTDVNLSDTKNLEKILETPLTVENYVQQNPAFADIVRSALKYQSCAKNLTFMSHVKGNNSLENNNATIDHKLLSGTCTLLNTTNQEKSSLNNLDQIDDDFLSQANNQLDKIKKKRGRKPKTTKEPESIPTNPSISSAVNTASIPNKSANSSIVNESNSTNAVKKPVQEQQFNMHPMYMMNAPPTHHNSQHHQHHHQGYYSNHPNHNGYLPPPPHMMRHGQSMPPMQGYHYPVHNMPPPPPHMQHPHFMRGGQMSHHHLPPHFLRVGGQGGTGHVMMPPPHPLPIHLQQQFRMRHPHPHQHPMYMPNNSNNNMSQNSDSSENSNFQTPQKYQKSNLGDRSIFKTVTPVIQESDKQIKYDEKNLNNNNNNNKGKINNFSNNEDDYYLANNSFSKENINPNTQHISNPIGKEALVPLNPNNNNNSLNVLQNHQTANLTHSNNNQSQNISGNGNSQNNGTSFITPNKYETPSKLLDFDSEPGINGNSVDKYFNMRDMRGYSSNQKRNNLYTNHHHGNSFIRSSNSAFKCYPHINMDYQDTPSAKKQPFS